MIALLAVLSNSSVEGHRLRAAPATNATKPSEYHDLKYIMSNKSGSVEAPRVPSALDDVGPHKKCRFNDVCDCGAAMEFMDCITDSCHNGNRYDCHELEYHRACVSMARTCQKLDFECSTRRSVCSVTVNMTDPERAAAMARRTDEELREELRAMQKDKCRLEHAMMHHDLLNADNELARLAPKVQRRIEELQSRDAGNIPSFDCEGDAPEKLAPKMKLKKTEEVKPSAREVTKPKVEPVSASSKSEQPDDDLQ